MKPVTLVSTVVARNTAVAPSSLLSFSMPSSTTMPVAMPMRLITTCTIVKVTNDIPKIIARLHQASRERSLSQGMPRTHGIP